jgi:hypothetical protein
MRYLEINGQPVDLPDSWAEMPWGKAVTFFQLLADEPNLSDIALRSVAILTGLGYDFWRKFQDVEKYKALAASCSWLWSENEIAEQLQLMEAKPMDFVTVGGKKYFLPHDLGRETVGQYEDAKRIAEAMNGYLPGMTEGDTFDYRKFCFFLEDSRRIFCIYLAGAGSVEYDYEKALALNIDDVPFPVVNKWRNFFLQRLNGYRVGTAIVSKK